MGLRPGGPAQPALPILPVSAQADVHSPVNPSPTLVTINTKPFTTFLTQVRWRAAWCLPCSLQKGSQCRCWTCSYSPVCGLGGWD